MLGSLLAAVISGEAAATARRLRTQAIVTSVLGAIALLGIVFLLIAAYLYLSLWVGALGAALWFGCVFIAVALLGYLAYRITAKARARREAERRKSDLASVAAATALAALPTLGLRAGGIGLAATPFLMAVGYLILKENTRATSPKDEDDDGPR
jgi:hypothetical protein